MIILIERILGQYWTICDITHFSKVSVIDVFYAFPLIYKFFVLTTLFYCRQWFYVFSVLLQCGSGSTFTECNTSTYYREFN